MLLSSDEEMNGMDEDEMVLDRIPLAGKNTFEGETIEDLLAQFETESRSRAVSCPNCKEYCPKNNIKNNIKFKSNVGQAKNSAYQSSNRETVGQGFCNNKYTFFLL